MKIALISCTKLKQEYPCVASEMYMPSTLFKNAKEYVGRNYNHWYILSAEHGLLTPNSWIHPYDKTLNNMTSDLRKEWSELVAQDILAKRPSEVDFYAGEKYRQYVIPQLEEKGFKCNVPLKGLGIGQQLGFYTRELNK